MSVNKEDKLKGQIGCMASAIESYGCYFNEAVRSKFCTTMYCRDCLLGRHDFSGTFGECRATAVMNARRLAKKYGMEFPEASKIELWERELWPSLKDKPGVWKSICGFFRKLFEIDGGR